MEDHRDRWPNWGRQVAPNALIAGAVVAFLGCCLAGWLASGRSPFERFVRFHQFLTPESLYYPTAGQVRAMARERLEPDKIAIVVAGSSRLHGTCQPEASVWTRRLQAELGDDFRVINLAVRCGNTFEFGEPAAETLLPDHPRLILVTDGNPGVIHPNPDGNRYSYFYWDAFYKGMLTPAPLRDAMLKQRALKEDARDRAGGNLTGSYAEMKLRMRLDSGSYFTDLWNWVGCRWAFTLWTAQSARPFTKPRHSLGDNDAGPAPLEGRFRLPHLPLEMDLFRCLIARVPVPEEADEANAEAIRGPSWDEFRAALRSSVPGAMRERIVLLVLRQGRFHLNQLSRADLLKYERICRATVRVTEAEGVAALEVGEEFAEADYADFLHFSPSGGDKLAVVVAAKVRQRARALGYVP
jgi:hypothetical protein